jgi:hypothetical protein
VSVLEPLQKKMDPTFALLLVSFAVVAAIVGLAVWVSVKSTRRSKEATGPRKPADWVQVGSNDIPGAAPYDRAGSSVAISADGKRVAVGALEHGGLDAGHVRVWQLNNDGVWEQLGNSDFVGDADDKAGTSVAMSADGKRVAVGAPFHNSHTADGEPLPDAGHVRVWELSSEGLWVPLGNDLVGDAGGDRAGSSVAMSADGTRVAVGAPNNGTGNVRVWQLNNDGVWEQLGTNDLIGENGNDRAGTSVAMSADGKRVAVGAPLHSSTVGFGGHVRVWQLNNDGGAWERLGVNDLVGDAADDRAGTSVAMSADGKRVAVGAPFHSPGNFVRAGRVRVWELNDTTNQWVRLGNNDLVGASGDEAGTSVAMSADGNIVAVGAAGSDVGSTVEAGRVHVWQLKNGEWEEFLGENNLTGKTSVEAVGTAVALSSDGKVVAFGASGREGYKGGASVWRWG